MPLYPYNTIHWRKGEVVFAMSDAKRPDMLMEVVGYSRDGLCKTQYIDATRKRTIWKNEISHLLNPEPFLPELKLYSGQMDEVLKHYSKTGILKKRWDWWWFWTGIVEIGDPVFYNHPQNGSIQTAVRSQPWFAGGDFVVALDGFVGGMEIERISRLITPEMENRKWDRAKVERWRDNHCPKQTLSLRLELGLTSIT